EEVGLRLLSNSRPPIAPVGPAPFFRLRFGDAGGRLAAYWVPDAGVVRTQNAYGSWMQLRPEESALLTEAATTRLPFAAPRRVSVTVGSHHVRPAPSTYLRLFTTGSPVTR